MTGGKAAFGLSVVLYEQQLPSSPAPSTSHHPAA